MHVPIFIYKNTPAERTTVPQMYRSSSAATTSGPAPQTEFRFIACSVCTVDNAFLTEMHCSAKRQLHHTIALLMRQYISLFRAQVLLRTLPAARQAAYRKRTAPAAAPQEKHQASLRTVKSIAGCKAYTQARLRLPPAIENP
jgi:hypothetical protein